MEKRSTSSSTQETQAIASNIASQLTTGITICLRGDLAAGKTTFAQGIASYFHISRLTSPTFIIMRQYPVRNHPVIRTLYHLDLYRLNSIDEIRSFDIDEIWSDPTNLLIIEWPEKFTKILPQNRIDVLIKNTFTDKREITIIKSIAV